MIRNIFKSAAAASVVMVGAATAAFAIDYKGPTMDFSKVQPEFRIGFLGDEAAQDIIARNACLKDYIFAGTL